MLPCAIAYNNETGVKLLTIKLYSTKSIKELNKIVDAYQNILHSTRDGITKSLASLMVIFYLVVGFQQLMEAFCVFQFIRDGAAWEYYQMILVDLVVRGLT